MSDSYEMSAEGLEALRAEVVELETNARAQIAAEIKTARGHGDLKENAEYHAAKDAQGMLERRIKQLRERLDNAVALEATGGGLPGRQVGGRPELALDLLERAVLRLRHPDREEDRRERRDAGIDPERARPAGCADQRQERERHDEVRAPVADGRDRHRRRAHPQREDLRDHQPEDGAEADGEAGDVG